MHRHLLLEAFKKAKKEKGFYTWRQAKHISNYIMNEHNEPFSPKSFVNYYKKSKKNPQERIQLREGVVTAVCKYLNCDDLESFKEKYPIENTPQKPKSIWELNIYIIR